MVDTNFLTYSAYYKGTGAPGSYNSSSLDLAMGRFVSSLPQVEVAIGRVSDVLRNRPYITRVAKALEMSADGTKTVAFDSLLSKPFHMGFFILRKDVRSGYVGDNRLNHMGAVGVMSPSVREEALRRLDESVRILESSLSERPDLIKIVGSLEKTNMNINLTILPLSTLSLNEILESSDLAALLNDITFLTKVASFM